MRWRVEFYHEGRGILAHYHVEASLPAAAVLAGRAAMLAEHPPVPARRHRLSLWERAERLAIPDGTGWVLYRIGKDEGQAATGIAASPAG
jgi:hypothetical protein